MTERSRAPTPLAQRAAALERWADDFDTDEFVETKTAALRTIAELVEHRDAVGTAFDAIRDARRADRSWSEIGAMLGVPKQGRPAKVRRKDLGVIPVDVTEAVAMSAEDDVCVG